MVWNVPPHVSCKTATIGDNQAVQQSDSEDSSDDDVG